MNEETRAQALKEFPHMEKLDITQVIHYEKSTVDNEIVFVFSLTCNGFKC